MLESKKKYELERFLKAQESDYNLALKEIRSGQKKSHWIWYIFPQLRGLGKSEMAEYYGISGLDEAEKYLKNTVLKERLIEISSALLELSTDDPSWVMGYPDDVKLQSSMTLFLAADPKINVFWQVLDKYYKGKKDQKTLKLLEKEREQKII